MDFELSEELQLIRNTARDFAQSEVAGTADARDREHRFPREEFRKAAELGFAGMLVPEAFGGAGLGALALAIVVEEVSLVDRAANKHRFLIVKRDEAMDDDKTQNTTPAEPSPPAAPTAKLDDNSALNAALAALESLTGLVELLGSLGADQADARHPGRQACLPQRRARVDGAQVGYRRGYRLRGEPQRQAQGIAPVVDTCGQLRAPLRGIDMRVGQALFREQAQLSPEVIGKVKAVLARLNAADRSLALAQKFCPVKQDTLLGSMGPPVRLDIKGLRSEGAGQEKIGAVEAEIKEQERLYKEQEERLTSLYREFNKEKIVMTSVDGEEKEMPLGAIVQAFRPNSMNWACPSPQW